MKIAIAGDFYIDKKYFNHSLIDSSVKNYLESVNFSIVNLEAPIIKENLKTGIIKTGPNLKMQKSIALNCLKELRINAVALANNHIYDYGHEGLFETINTLDSHEIKYVGAGMNLLDAKKPLLINLESCTRIAVLNFCENEFSTLFNGISSCVNPYSHFENCKQISSLKAEYEKVICIVHGGNEYVTIPSPRMTSAFRSFVDAGADAVVCHHSHCISAYEIYNESPIVYGLGNFLFSMDSDHECWYNGLIAELDILVDEPIRLNLKVVSQNRNNFALSLANEEQTNKILSEVREINNLLLDSKRHKKKWEHEILKLKDEYLSILSPTGSFPNKWLKSFFWRTKLFKWLFNPAYTAILLNMLRCEAHRDALELILKQKLDDSNTFQ